MSFFRYLLVTLALLALFGCQTNMKKAFDRVQQGMDKHSVLGLLGNPDSTLRWQDRDRWIYRIPDNNGNLHTQEVHFYKGRAVYKGSPPKPKVGAELQDHYNAERNATLAAKWEEERDANRHLYNQMEDEIREESKETSRSAGD